MDAPRIIQKSIEGRTYHYDRWLDIIASDIPYVGTPLDRTQVERPVDLCIEITTWCNFTCVNCFSESRRGVRGVHLPTPYILEYIKENVSELIRISLTGGEPFMHPEIELILELPSLFPGLGFVITTNGTLRADLDDHLVEQGWLTAISLHGRAKTHNEYCRHESFEIVTQRMKRISRRGLVHIYTVVHNQLSCADVDWLFHFRDEIGAKFLRFIVPRSFGRFERLADNSILEHLRGRLDAQSGLKTQKSLTTFVSALGGTRKSM